MGKVSFAAVLRWVTRIDDFTKLLFDTIERERVLHLQRNEECALTYLRWRVKKDDHRAVVAARESVSDYACHLFNKQIQLVSNILEQQMFHHICFFSLSVQCSSGAILQSSKKRR